MKDDKIIMHDSDEAAKLVTITGWLAADGTFWKDDERMARYCGSTHTRCRDCDSVIEKRHVICDACSNLKDIEKYKSMPKQKWDGKAMLYSDSKERYYDDLSDALDDLGDYEGLADLRLIICEPNYAHEIDDDFYCDACADDGDLPSEVQAAMDAYNEAINGVILSWSPGKFAIDLGETA